MNVLAQNRPHRKVAGYTYLEKPFTATGLAQRVRQVLDTHVHAKP